MMENKLIQITSGKGPEECERVVFLVFQKLVKQLLQAGIAIEIVETIDGRQLDTCLSALFKASGTNLTGLMQEWKGTIQWTAQSPFRPFHKRKNWFTGISMHDIPVLMNWNEKDVTYQTMRASGPGGQNVNKVESAVRATHVPTGSTVTASSERSQLLNKKEATERLKNKLIYLQIETSDKQVQEQWMEHNSLERGNPVKVFKESL